MVSPGPWWWSQGPACSCVVPSSGGGSWGLVLASVRVGLTPCISVWGQDVWLVTTVGCCPDM